MYRTMADGPGGPHSATASGRITVKAVGDSVDPVNPTSREPAIDFEHPVTGAVFKMVVSDHQMEEFLSFCIRQSGLQPAREQTQLFEEPVPSAGPATPWGDPDERPTSAQSQPSFAIEEDLDGDDTSMF